MSDAIHARGCRGERARPALTLDGYRYCPDCQRMIREEVGHEGP